MDATAAREWLDSEWHEVLTAADPTPDAEIDRLVNSEVAAIRYALITQIVGKIADETRSLLYLQSGTGEPGAWNARSFCDKVIVPWVSDNHDVIGTSTTPYLSNPLRRAMFSQGMEGVRDREEWDRLTALLETWDRVSQDELRAVCRRCLAAIARRLAGQSFKYPIPLRISAARTLAVLEAFLSDQSGGVRPMVIAAALMQVVGEGFKLFDRVDSQGVYEADVATGAPGDVMCYAEDGSLVLAVEVKDQRLTLADVRSSVRKAQQSDTTLRSLLFAVPGLREAERTPIADSMEKAWAAGLNLYRIDLLDLATASFVLLDENWRPTLLRAVGSELDRRGDHRHRQAWRDLLAGITGENDA